jgi:hypothetical protein
LNLTLIFILALISLTTFCAILIKNYPDIYIHNLYVSELVQGNVPLVPHFIYFFVLAALSLFSNKIIVINAVSVIVLSASVVLKYIVTKKIMGSEINLNENSIYPKSLINKFSFLVAFTLLLLFSLPVKLSATMYYGQFPPNVWHNSTLIFLMPFALLLFIESYKHLKNESHSSLVYFSLLCMLNVFIKPNYFMAFAIAFPLFSLFRYKLTSRFFLLMIPVFIGTVALFVASLLYSSNSALIQIKFLAVWRNWSDNIPFSFLASVPFPLLYFILNYKEAKKNMLLLYASLIFIVSMIIYMFLAESGTREGHGNFGWQIIASNFMLHLAVAIQFVNKIISQKGSFEKQDRILVAIYLLQLIVGIVYLVKLPFFGPR